MADPCFCIQNNTEVFCILNMDWPFVTLYINVNTLNFHIVQKDKTMDTTIVNVSVKVNSMTHIKILLPGFWLSAFLDT